MHAHGKIDVSVANVAEAERAFELAAELGLAPHKKSVWGSWYHGGKLTDLSDNDVRVINALRTHTRDGFFFEVDGERGFYEATRGDEPNGCIEIEFVSDPHREPSGFYTSVRSC